MLRGNQIRFTPPTTASTTTATDHDSNNLPSYFKRSVANSLILHPRDFYCSPVRAQPLSMSYARITDCCCIEMHCDGWRLRVPK